MFTLGMIAGFALLRAFQCAGSRDGLAWCALAVALAAIDYAIN